MVQPLCQRVRRFWASGRQAHGPAPDLALFGGLRRGLLFGVAIVSVVLVGAVLAPVSGASAQSDPVGLSGVRVERFGGADRFATEALVSQRWLDVQDRRVENVVLVSGEHWPEAVAAAPVASSLGGFVMFANGRRTDRVTLTELVGRLKEIRSGGTNGENAAASGPAARVTVVSAAPPGGKASLPSLIAERIGRAGIETVTAGGANQYETSVAAARLIGAPGSLAGKGRTAILAKGDGGTQGFADSLAAGPLAYKHRLPILLTSRNALHADVQAYLVETKIKHVILMGGTSALKPAVERAVTGLGIYVKRINGTDRYHTAALFADYSAQVSHGCFDGPDYALSTGLLPFDAMAAAPLLAERCAPVLFTRPDRLPAATTAYLNTARRRAYSDNQGTVKLTVLGGQAAVSDVSLARYRSASPATNKYRYRSPDSALPAVDWYFNNHAEIADSVTTVFGECITEHLKTPGYKQQLDTALANREFYRGFDSELRNVPVLGKPTPVAVGWWTDEKLQRIYGDKILPGITVKKAKDAMFMHPDWGMIALGNGDYFNYKLEGPPSGFFYFDAVDRRLALDGWSAENNHKRARLEFGGHEGPYKGRGIEEELDNWGEVYPLGGGRLIGAWAIWSAQYPPTLGEPGGWGYLTLQQTTPYYLDERCTVSKIFERCGVPFTKDTPAHLRNDEHSSPLGRLLWNLICGERGKYFLPDGWQPPPVLRTLN